MQHSFGLKYFIILSLNYMFFSGLNSFGQDIRGDTDASLKLITTIALPGVSGRIDHLAYNSRKQVVYVAALGNNTVEVVDIKSRKVIQSIKGLSEPQGIRYIPERNVIFIANGGNGECTVFSADTYHQVALVRLGGDADNVRYTPATNKIYVGYGDGAIAVIEADNFKKLSDIKLPGHPESFQPENDSKIYVNVPDAHLLEVIDLVTWMFSAKSARINMKLFRGLNHAPVRAPRFLFLNSTS